MRYTQTMYRWEYSCYDNKILLFKKKKGYFFFYYILLLCIVLNMKKGNPGGQVVDWR